MAPVLSLSPEWVTAMRSPVSKSGAASAAYSAMASASSATHPPPRLSTVSGRPSQGAVRAARIA